MSDCGHNHDHDHSRTIDWLDQIGIWASFVCLIHCALTPIVLAVMPMLIWGGDRMHVILAAILPLIALAAFIPGYLQHRQWTVLALAVAGLSLIVLALGAPKPYAEIALTMSGSLLLIRAHWRNRQLKYTHDKCQKTRACD